jgi:L-2-hydroxyglutarate oxidase
LERLLNGAHVNNTTVVIIGGGIVGLAIAREIATQGRSVTLLEKEDDFGRHQTGRNSGVIHAGPYYRPGSLKAALCTEGNRLMTEFAKEHSIPHQVTGKLLIATNPEEISWLDVIAEKAKANGVRSEIINATRIKELEPHAAGLAALHVKTTGIIDYGLVARKFAEIAAQNGANLVLGAEARKIHSSNGKTVIEHTQGSHQADLLINAAGLHSDRIAKMAGINPNVRIVPFRGEYFELTPAVSDRVRGLVYPVPNPRLPFLGVHLTKMISGGVHAGPNAVMALAREGYTWGDFNLRDVWETLSNPGFAKLALSNIPTGISELVRSLSPALFARDLSKLVPGIRAEHLKKSESGVRAQAIDRSGNLVDDFVIQETNHQVHILNTPSPAATASIAIARHLVSRLTVDG